MNIDNHIWLIEGIIILSVLHAHAAMRVTADASLRIVVNTE